MLLWGEASSLQIAELEHLMFVNSTIFGNNDGHGLCYSVIRVFKQLQNKYN